MLSLIFGAIILLVGAIVSRLESNKFDMWTWISIGGVFFLLIALLSVFIMISRRTKEIREIE